MLEFGFPFKSSKSPTNSRQRLEYLLILLIESINHFGALVRPKHESFDTLRLVSRKRFSFSKMAIV